MTLKTDKLYRMKNTNKYYFVESYDEEIVAYIRCNKNGLLLSQSSNLWRTKDFLNHFEETEITL